MNGPILPAVAVAIPAIATLAILRCDGRPNLREACSLAAAVGLLLTTGFLVAGLQPETPVEVTLAAMLPGVDLRLRVDAFGAVFAMLASVLWLATSVYSIGYMRGLKERAQTRYFASFAAAVSATIGVAFAANLLTFYLFYEILTFATYPLVAHKETEQALVASRKYLVYTLSAGVALLAGMAVLYASTGTLEFAPGGIDGLASAPVAVQYFVFGALIAGFGVKAALLPLHGWLPSAMVAPTPVSALLHAVAVVKSGVFGCVRTIAFVFGADTLRELGTADWLAYLAGATVLFGSIVALSQDNLKRRLAYSTISHLSYIVLGAALLSANATTGAVLHMVNHGLLKITLFFCAGAIYVTTGCDRVSQLAGIGRRMPLTMGAFAVASLGLAGLPSLNGFISKWYLCLGGLESDHAALAVVLIASGILNVAYLFPVVYMAFFRASDEFPRYGEASMAMVVPLLITAFASVLLGLWPDAGPGVWSLAHSIARSVQ
jgi:formate hydrogenlyase subunit 3/multisubunit Na+/H+ antiporter MnhD subunit